MSKPSKYCVAFAGPIGSSKTPIAQYLSQNFNLLIFSNDVIRTEVAEDFLGSNHEEYKKRKDQRGEELLKQGYPFIYDASIDREWAGLKERLVDSGYSYFIVSLDLSKDFLVKLYEVKGYLESLKRIDLLITDHENFLAEYGHEVNVKIDDQSFPNRLVLVTDAFSKWLDKD